MSCKETGRIGFIQANGERNDELLAAYEKRRKEIVGSEISGI